MRHTIVFLTDAMGHEPDMDPQTLPRLVAVNVHLKRLQMREAMELTRDEQGRVIWS